MGWVGLSTNKSYIFLSQGIEKVKSRLGWVCVTFQSYYQGSTCGRAWTGTGLPELALNVNFAAFKDREGTHVDVWPNLPWHDVQLTAQ